MTHGRTSASNTEARCPSDGSWFSCGRDVCNLQRTCKDAPKNSILNDAAAASCACPPSFGNSTAISDLLERIAHEAPGSGLLRFGYYAVRDGSVHMEKVGSDHITGVWAGGKKADLDVMLADISLMRPSTTFIVFRCDTGDSLTALLPQHWKALKEAGVVILVASLRRSYWIRLAPIVRLLPSPWTDDYDLKQGRRLEQQIRRLEQKEPQWEDRTSKCVWRGMSSGVYPKAEHNPAAGKMVKNDLGGIRLAVMNAVKDSPLADVGFSSVHFGEDHPAFNGLIKPRMTGQKQAAYKCVFVMDGWGWPGNLRWALGSGSVPLIASNAQVGFMSELEPYVHYIPIEADGSDAKERLNEVLDPKNREAMSKVATAAQTFARDELLPSLMRQRLERVMLYGPAR